MTASIADFSLSCAAMPVRELELDAGGWAVGDRGWAIVDAQDTVTWQGAHARLALVRPRRADGRLVLGGPGADDIVVPADAALAPCRVKIWNDLGARHDVFDAADAGAAIAAWLERVVGAPLRLVRLSDAARTREGNNALHLVFAASVAAVDADLTTQGRPPADPLRYRPNIVLAAPADDGVEFIEDSLDALEWLGAAGAGRLAITAPCVRCVVPNGDPVSAGVDDTVGDTLTRLSQQRRPGATVFGVYARGPAGACLRLGDTARMTLAF